MSYLIQAPVVAYLDATDFDGAATVFANLLPCEPMLGAVNDVMLVHSGVGALKRVASSPGTGEFALSGTANRTVTFGIAPQTGDWIHAVFVAA